MFISDESKDHTPTGMLPGHPLTGFPTCSVVLIKDRSSIHSGHLHLEELGDVAKLKKT